jgi:hypothetical protein
LDTTKILSENITGYDLADKLLKMGYHITRTVMLNGKGSPECKKEMSLKTDKSSV